MDHVLTRLQMFLCAAVSWRQRQEFMTSALVTPGPPSSSLSLSPHTHTHTHTHTLVCSSSSRQSMVSARLTMSGVCGASLRVFVFTFCGVLLSSEAQTPSPAPGEFPLLLLLLFCFFFFFKLSLLGFVFCPAGVKSGGLSHDGSRTGFSPIIWTKIIVLFMVRSCIEATSLCFSWSKVCESLWTLLLQGLLICPL